MRDALRKLNADVLVYGFGQALGRGVQFLLVPILTRILAPDVYGVSDLVFAYSQLVILVLVFGTDAALVRFFYEEPDREARRRMSSTSLTFRLAVGTTVALCLWSAAGSLAGPLFGSEAYRKYLTIGAWTLPFSLIVLFGNDLLRVTLQPWKYIALNIAQALITFALSWWWVAQVRLGVVGILYGKLAGDFCAALLALGLTWRYFTPRLNSAALHRMLSFGAPLVPTAFFYGVISAADRYSLQHFRSLTDVGVYAVGVKFFALVMVGVQSFSMAFFPFAHARAETPEAPKIYAIVFARYVALASWVALAASLFAPEALVLVPQSYRAAAGPAVMLTFAAVAFGAYYVACLGVQRARKTKWLMLTAFIGALASVAANLLLTPRFGPTGASAATFLGNTALAVSTYWVSQLVFPLPYRGARLAALFSVAVILALAGQRWISPGAVGATLKLALLLVFLVLCRTFGVWEESGGVSWRARSENGGGR